MSNRGLTLLEVMVALVILGLVVVGYLEVFGGALRSAATARTWSDAVTYATDEMERVKLERGASPIGAAAPERLPGGFERYVETAPWESGLTRVTVVVVLPGGGRYALERLVPGP